MRLAPRHARTIRASTLKQAARAALDVARVRRAASLSIVVTGDAALRRFNRDFLGIDAPTDVLSFSSDEAGSYLGDVLISLARARAQAARGGHPLIDELRLLVIHGVLHLLGHDHDAPQRKARMWAVQAKALRRAQASIEGPD